MNFSALAMVLIVILTISFMSLRDMAVSGSLRGLTTPSVTSEPAQ